MKTKITSRIIFFLLIPFWFALSASSSSTPSGCDADTDDNVYSSEVASMVAADIRLVADIYEYNTMAWADVSAHMQTLSSHTGINFNQGETLAVQYDTADGLSGPTYLYQEETGEPYSSAYIEKTISGGTYIITYTDKDDNQTSATLQSLNTIDITSIINGDIISTNPVTITWDTSLVTGSVAIAYECGSSHYSYTNVENSGSYDLTHECYSGVGAIKLKHTKIQSSVEGFGEASVAMYNIVEKNVSFDVATSVVESPDNDGDGYTEDEDCDDGDATINPGAEDVCEDGIDQNCNGEDVACPAEEESDSGGCSLNQDLNATGKLSLLFLFACVSLLLYVINRARSMNN